MAQDPEVKKIIGEFVDKNKRIARLRVDNDTLQREFQDIILKGSREVSIYDVSNPGKKPQVVIVKQLLEWMEKGIVNYDSQAGR